MSEHLRQRPFDHIPRRRVDKTASGCRKSIVAASRVRKKSSVLINAALQTLRHRIPLRRRLTIHAIGIDHKTQSSYGLLPICKTD